jgi:hypothetical protein
VPRAEVQASLCDAANSFAMMQRCDAILNAIAIQYPFCKSGDVGTVMKMIWKENR